MRARAPRRNGLPVLVGESSRGSAFRPARRYGSLVRLHPMTPDHASALAGAGFRRHVIATGTQEEREVYRRPARGPWFLEARREGDGHVDVGLTLDSEGGVLVGPVHRALSAAALAAALPHITASLETLAGAAESLRCPECKSWAVMTEGADGPFLACGQTIRGRRPFDRAIRRCRRNLALASLIVYGAPTPPW